MTAPRRPTPRRPRVRALLTFPLLIASAAAFAEVRTALLRSRFRRRHRARVRADALRYRVVIEAPAPLRDTLAASVDLIRWQGYDEMTASLFDALRAKAIDQAKEAAATEGFFSATSTSTSIGRQRHSPLPCASRRAAGARERSHRRASPAPPRPMPKATRRSRT